MKIGLFGGTFNVVQFLSTVIDQTPGKLPSLRIQTTDALPNSERAPNFSETGGQQALSLMDQRLVGPTVYDNLS